MAGADKHGGAFEVAYPDDLLSEGEQVVVHNHPHFKMLIFPFFIFLVTVGVGIWLAILSSDAASPWNNIALIAIGVVGLILIVWLFLAPFVRWRTTHFIVTTDRLIAREGVIKRTGIDIPMSRINSVQFEHGLLDRVFGCGTLIIESASDEPLRFDDIPHVERVHTVIYREVNDNPHDDYRRNERAPGHRAPGGPAHPVDHGYQGEPESSAPPTRQLGYDQGQDPGYGGYYEPGAPTTRD